MRTEPNFERISSARRLRSMMKADARRMFTSGLFYILVGACLLLSVLILVMTTMAGGSTISDPQTGVETTVESFTNTWQVISSYSSSGMSMDLTSMCNLNLVYFVIAVLVCLFTAGDFKSGYAKNLFAVRSKRNEYIVSRTLLFCLCGAVLVLAFFVGALVGGKAAGLSFALGSATVFSLICCLLAKVFLVAVFVPIFLCCAVFAKQRTWLGLLISLFAGMLLFMMVPMMTPLDATVLHAGMCLAGGALFSIGLGAAGTALLRNRDLV